MTTLATLSLRDLALYACAMTSLSTIDPSAKTEAEAAQ